MSVLGFVINLSDEPAEQLQTCLMRLRYHYPESPVVVIEDGLASHDIESVAHQYNAHHNRGSYLKRAECGGRWWNRSLHAAVQLGCEYVLKIDPDTWINRRFTHLPTGSLSRGIAGRVHNAGTSKEVIQGGAQLFHHTAIERILASGVLNGPQLRSVYAYLPNDIHGMVDPSWLTTGYMCSDYLLMHVMREVGLKSVNWPDCYCYHRQTPSFNATAQYPISHPHKVRCPQVGYGPGEALHVVVTCKGRWKHLSQTLASFVETNTTITIVDYDCPDRTAARVAEANELKKFEHHLPKIRVVHYRPEVGDDSFNLNRARNLGAADTATGWLCFLDADLALKPGWGNMVRSRLRPGYYFTATPGKWGMSGSCVVEADAYQKVNGYDELYQGWGCDDIDFYLRLRQAGVRPGGWDDSLAESIKHTDADRVRFQAESKEDRHEQLSVYFAAKRDWIVEHDRLPGLRERQGIKADAERSVRELTAMTSEQREIFFRRHPRRHWHRHRHWHWPHRHHHHPHPPYGC